MAATVAQRKTRWDELNSGALHDFDAAEINHVVRLEDAELEARHAELSRTQITDGHLARWRRAEHAVVQEILNRDGLPRHTRLDERLQASAWRPLRRLGSAIGQYRYLRARYGRRPLVLWAHRAEI